MRARPPTDDEMRAELLRQHIRINWTWQHLVILPDGPMRRALRRAGYIEYRKRHDAGSGGRRPQWLMTEKGWRSLINQPGSRIKREPALRLGG